MSKEQTPIEIIQLMYESPDLPKPSEKGFFFMSNQVKWLMEQYAQFKVRQALEREVPKAFEKGYSIGMDDSIAIELRQDPLEMDGKEYHETQVKPKYE